MQPGAHRGRGPRATEALADGRVVAQATRRSAGSPPAAVAPRTPEPRHELPQQGHSALRHRRRLQRPHLRRRANQRAQAAHPGARRRSRGRRRLHRTTTSWRGQRYYLSRGGQHIGSIWGHGAYLAPDWSADSLHRIGAGRRRAAARARPRGGARRSPRRTWRRSTPASAAASTPLVAEELKHNRYDAGHRHPHPLAGQAAAVPGAGRLLHRPLQRRHGRRCRSPPASSKTPSDGRQLTAFFFWTAWAAGTNRPGETYTYTANWPYDPLVGNRPAPLRAGLVDRSASSCSSSASPRHLPLPADARRTTRSRRSSPSSSEPQPDAEPARHAARTSSSRSPCSSSRPSSARSPATTRSRATSSSASTSARLLPYAATRTWHLQLAVFWIATCWLATGLFIGPAVGRREPKGQKALVLTLLGALVVVVVGALAGTYLASRASFGGDGFLLGHQGYEYIELGRVWQVGAHRRDAALAGARLPRHPAGAEGREGPRRPHPPAALRLGLDPALLLGRPVLHAGQPHLDRRLLALVGGAPLGRELLRGLRHRGARLRARAHRRGAATQSARAPPTSASSSTWARASSARSTTSTSPARRCSSPRSARPSRRWRSSR